jgi:hypothetical protein
VVVAVVCECVCMCGEGGGIPELAPSTSTDGDCIYKGQGVHAGGCQTSPSVAMPESPKFTPPARERVWGAAK